MAWQANIKDIAWLAGLLEGEGTFGAYGSGRNNIVRPTITMHMTDRDIVERAARILSCNVYGPIPQRGFGTKVTWNFYLRGLNAVGWMYTLYSFLGYRRRRQIDEVICNWKYGFITRSSEQRTILDRFIQES